MDGNDSLALLTAARVVIVAGKGGVGKSTVTAVLARLAARRGDRVLVVELDEKPALARLIPDIEVRTIVAADALDDYLRDHGFARIATRLSASGVIDVVGTAAPGIDDLVVLGKIKHLERAGDHDLILVDGPAAGHAITMLGSPVGILEAVGSGPVRTQAVEVLDMLRDPRRCQVVLVTIAETTPVNELIETAFALEDRVGVQLGPVVVNGLETEPDWFDDDGTMVAEVIAAARDGGRIDDREARALAAAAAFRTARHRLQVGELERLAETLPLPIVGLQALPIAGVDAVAIDGLADALGSVGP